LRSSYLTLKNDEPTGYCAKDNTITEQPATWRGRDLNP
jgi:hypothetical protein